MKWAGLCWRTANCYALPTRFDVMVTCDKNLPYQQNMSRRQLALVVLTTNDWNVVKNKTEPVVAAVNVARPGSFQLVSLD
jgi:hypothetical protein